MAFWEGNRSRSVDSAAWTGAGNASVMETPPRLASAPKTITPRVDRDLLSAAAIEEYRTVSAEIGLGSTDILLEEFRAFLAKHDIPTFNLAEVAAYMDAAAKRDNPKGFGWHWCPVREKDGAHKMRFGQRSERDHNTNTVTLASDFYESHQWAHYRQQQVNGDPPQTAPYTRTIPLHALKKIALIERSFKDGDLAFLVSDYATAPHAIIGPDPFLMAVIPNSAVGMGKGRFVIDVWDEPGFGIDKMVK